ncbi:hypothetical protein V1523DRAFT_406766 [Lipomyces doorenjongii]
MAPKKGKGQKAKPSSKSIPAADWQSTEVLDSQGRLSQPLEIESLPPPTGAEEISKSEEIK